MGDTKFGGWHGEKVPSDSRFSPWAGDSNLSLLLFLFISPSSSTAVSVHLTLPVPTRPPMQTLSEIEVIRTSRDKKSVRILNTLEELQQTHREVSESLRDSVASLVS